MRAEPRPGPGPGRPLKIRYRSEEPKVKGRPRPPHSLPLAVSLRRRQHGRRRPARCCVLSPTGCVIKVRNRLGCRSTTTQGPRPSTSTDACHGLSSDYSHCGLSHVSEHVCRCDSATATRSLLLTTAHHARLLCTGYRYIRWPETEAATIESG